MKAKVYIGVVLAITIAALCVHYLRQPADNSNADSHSVDGNSDVPVSTGTAPAANETPSVSGPAEEQPAANEVVSAPATIPSAPSSAPVAVQTKPLPDQAQAATVVRSQVIRLGRLSLENDAASLNEIVAELTNSNKTVRQAALDAAVDFGSKDAASGLRAAAAAMEDPYEKVALLDAADFVELPDFSETLARKKIVGGVRTNGSRLGSRGAPRPVQAQ